MLMADFTSVNAEMARVDVDDSKDSTAKAWRLSAATAPFPGVVQYPALGKAAFSV